MSLLVWLPLNGNLTNQGLRNVTITNNGATVDNGGKIGKCYSFNGSSSRIQIDNLSNPANISVAFWMLRSANTGTRQFMFTAWNGVTCELTTDNKIHCYVAPSHGACDYGSITTSSGWVHVVYTFQDKVGAKLYVNGSLVTTTASTSSISWSTTTGQIGYFSTYFNGKLNDFRIYDHVLSLKEVKEISKAKVLHWPMSDELGSGNLIINGFGEGGQNNWENANYSTSEIPSGNTDIKASYYSDNTTKDYIPINPKHSYTMSCYIKTTGGTSGSVYPAILPYDIDKKFIQTQHSAEGFNNSYKTTLAQPLKKGDTIVYATNISSWTTATDNHYFYVAVFGYKDSTGYTWPDMVYTQDALSFGSKTDKSRINKTNNTITLLSAYTGEDRPAGTTICQSTAGNTYYYPFGGIALSSITDWTFKSATFTPENVNRLQAAKYFRWKAYNGAYHAGNKLIDNNDNQNLLYDISGYLHNGTPVSTYSLLEVNSPRYGYCHKYIGSINHCHYNNTTELNFTDNFSWSIWVKTNYTGTSAQYIFTVGRADAGGYGYGLQCTSTTNCTVKYGNASYSVAVTGGTWTHIAFTKSGSTIKIYKNGALYSTNTFSGTAPTYSDGNGVGIGCFHYSSNIYPYYGSISDFRIYATTLTDADIKELYNTSASIDKNGDIFAYEFSEC